MNPHVRSLIERIPELQSCAPDLDRAIELVGKRFATGGKLLVCGSGGSAADAEHIAGELAKGFLLPRRPSADFLEAVAARLTQTGLGESASRLQKGLPVISLSSNVALLTAISNDQGAELVFAQQVLALAGPGDALLAISTSGESRAAILAMACARELGALGIALTGRSGSTLFRLADVAIRVPAAEVALTQELHLPVYHTFCAALEDRFFGLNAAGPP